MAPNPFTDDQYLSMKRRVQDDTRYPNSFALWALSELDRMYVERNGKQPPKENSDGHKKD